MINALYLPSSTKPTASTSPFKNYMRSSQSSLVGTLENLDLNTASPSSDCSNDPQCICEIYAITRDGGRIKLDCSGGRQCGGDGSCSDSEEENSGT